MKDALKGEVRELMILTNDELKKIYFGAYEFEETSDGFLKALVTL